MKPMVLTTSINADNLSTKECFKFVQMYYQRWSIEMLFKEVKSWFCFEDFQLISFVSIMKFLHMIVFCHTLLTLFLDYIDHNWELKLMITQYLKRTRNIKTNKLTIIGLKLYCESMKNSENHEFYRLSQNNYFRLKNKQKEEVGVLVL